MQSLVRRPFSITFILISGIFMLGLILRLGWIDAHGFWTDEISSMETARNGLPYIFENRFGWLGNQTAWHYALVWLLMQPFDPAVSSFLVRLPSELAGAFLVPVIYALGRDLFKPVVGVAAAFMTALSPVLLDYSHDLRPYSLLAFFTAASVYCLVRAERTHKAGWWVGFAVTTIANLLNTYVATTLVLPAMSPYLVWSLWRAWSGRREDGGGRNLLYMLIALGASGLAAISILLEVMRMPRISPDWSRFTLLSPLKIADQLQVWFTTYGIAGSAAATVSLALLLLALCGVLWGLRSGHIKGVVICALLCLVPSAILSVLATTNPVFQRYAIFTGPFFFLLVGGGAAYLVEAVRGQMRGVAALAGRAGAFASLGLIALVSVVGAVNYLRPETYPLLSYRQDFRGVAQYLSRVAHSNDLVVLAGDSHLGHDVTVFYWHNSPPATLMDARDPLLADQAPEGDIYWVVDALDPDLMRYASADEKRWSSIEYFDMIVVLRQERAVGSPRLNVLDNLERLADDMSHAPGSMRHVLTLRGSILQARGDIAGAVSAYTRAGVLLPIAGEYMRTANGFLGVGQPDKAWRQAIIAKTLEPSNAQVHDWLAERLAEAGHEDESRREAAVANGLELVPTPGGSVR